MTTKRDMALHRDAFAAADTILLGSESAPTDTLPIVTTAPNDLLAPLRDRMPVSRGVALLPRRGAGRRLPAEGAADAYPSEKMVVWPVSQRVGDVRNNDPSLIGPIAAEAFQLLQPSGGQAFERVTQRC